MNGHRRSNPAVAFLVQSFFSSERLSRVRILIEDDSAGAPMPLRSLPATERQVMLLKIETVILLITGGATFVVALLQLVVKLIELGRK